MRIERIVFWLIIGVVSGWVAGLIVGGSSFEIPVDILVGVIGAFAGGWAPSRLGIKFFSDPIASNVVAVAGAAILLLGIRLVRSVIS
ncbi:GlsB/YeaQ/YmgE family stress response membrane protein [Paraburkholderia domus]|uniref:GlsB/YeaQ/YmgE family stress response membrane protein n=1 Tax=Paraburkholderia domus TaxID=2793075 RepID=A0A9N8QUX8_9BURK|nr:GlsB/YeaQ/YmgE family stress response membrane protein [Paraburkholderia domus]MBK5170060.1 GlsB/YeaQ/YmgE family stress response membrane protein [Burkholderia sp. R-70211]CAE6871723.1 hypothetical protein R70211_01291 [Paraburkholderia domus]